MSAAPDEPPKKDDAPKKEDAPKSEASDPISKALKWIGGVVAGLALILRYGKELIDFLRAQPPLVQWAAIVIPLLVGSLLWFRQRRSLDSRLVNADAFSLDPTKPDHLIGRKGDLDNLANACDSAQLVWLSGESGAGKSSLIRAGLLPRLRKDGTFSPFCLSSWGARGEDWAAFPAAQLAAVVQRELTEAERKALALDGVPVSPATLFDTLAKFSEKTGRPPLLVFDQFDDYLAVHRDKFLDAASSAWIKPAALTRRNAFWREIKKLLDGGKARMLFVVRDELAVYLDAIRFREATLLPLPRLLANNIRSILDILAEAPDPKKPVVANLMGGWEELKDHLSEDLADDDVVLPVKIQSAVQGLASLRDPALTVRNYQRAGGLAGLEAAFVERCVKDAQERFALPPEIARRVLSALVVDGHKPVPKTVPKSASELAALIGLPDFPPNKLFEVWEKAKLLRRMVGTPSAGQPGEAQWALAHDYLTRSVVAAEQRATFWMRRLAEGKRAFGKASGFFASWDAMLSLREQARVCWERLRGRLRYGEQAGFARRSLLRFSPWVLAIAAAWGLKLFLDAKSARSDAKVFATKFAGMQDIGLSNSDQLWKLAAARKEVRQKFWQEVFAEPEDAGKILESGKMIYLVQATIGLDPTGEGRRNLKEQVWASLRVPRQKLEVLCLAQALTHLAELDDPELAQLLVTELLAAISANDSRAKFWLADAALAAAAGKLDPAPAKQAFDTLLAAFGAGDSGAKSQFADALAAAAGKLDPAPAKQAFDTLLAAFGAGDSGAKSQFADALAAAAGKAGPVPAKQAFDTLLAALGVDNSGKKLRLANALAAAAGKAGPDQAKQAFDTLLAAFNADDSIEKFQFAAVLATATGKLDPASAKQAFDALLATPSADDDIAMLRFADALAAAAGKLDPASAKQAFDTLLAAFGANDSRAKFWLTAALAAAAGKLDPAPAKQAFDTLLVAFNAGDSGAKSQFPAALAAAAGKAGPVPAKQAFDTLLAAFNAGNSFAKLRLANALAAAAGKAGPDQAKQAFDTLLAALGAGDSIAKRELATALAAAARGKLEREQRQLFFQILKWPICVYESRTTILRRLEEDAGEKFEDNLFKAVDWGRRQGLDLTGPPNRDSKIDKLPPRPSSP